MILVFFDDYLLGFADAVTGLGFILIGEKLQGFILNRIKCTLIKGISGFSVVYN